MTGTLKVTPEKLTATANEFKTQGQSIRTLTAEMLSLVNGMNGVWQGDAQTAFAGRLKALDGDMGQIQKKIEDHVKDLTQMAANYTQAETENSSDLNALPADFITG